MSKHTPGPWKWNRLEAKGEIPVTTLEGPDVLCRFWDIGFDGTEDAHLIAAAPELLRECKAQNELLSQVMQWQAAQSAEQGGNLQDYSELSDRFISAQAVIAKAEGEQ